jgi:hypothetical protein
MTRREKELADQLVQCQRELTAARQENLRLRQKIELLVRRVFGASSERLDRAQLELLLQLPALAETTAPIAVVAESKVTVSRSRKERAPRLPDHLPVVEEVLRVALTFCHRKNCRTGVVVFLGS